VEDAAGVEVVEGVDLDTDDLAPADSVFGLRQR